MTMTTLPPLYGSLPFERRGMWDATIAAPSPLPIPPVTIDIDAHAIRELTTMTKSPGNPASHPNHATASRQRVLHKLRQPFPGPAYCQLDGSPVMCLQQAPDRAAVPTDVGQRMARTIGEDDPPSSSSSSSTSTPRTQLFLLSSLLTPAAVHPPPQLPTPHHKVSGKAAVSNFSNDLRQQNMGQRGREAGCGDGGGGRDRGGGGWQQLLVAAGEDNKGGSGRQGGVELFSWRCVCLGYNRR